MYKEFIWSRENYKTGYSAARTKHGDKDQERSSRRPSQRADSSCSSFVIMFKVLISLASEAKGTEHSKVEESFKFADLERNDSSEVNLLKQPAQLSKPSSLFLFFEDLEVLFELLLFFKAEFFVEESHFFVVVVVEGNSFLLFSWFDSLAVVCFDFQARFENSTIVVVVVDHREFLFNGQIYWKCKVQEKVAAGVWGLEPGLCPVLLRLALSSNTDEICFQRNLSMLNSARTGTQNRTA